MPGTHPYEPANEVKQNEQTGENGDYAIGDPLQQPGAGGLQDDAQ